MMFDIIGIFAGAVATIVGGGVAAFNLVKNSGAEPDIDDESDLDTINTTIENHKQWLDTHQEESYDVYDYRLKDVEGVIMPIMTKLYQQNGGMPQGAEMPQGTEMPQGGMPYGAEMPQQSSPPSDNISVEEVD